MSVASNFDKGWEVCMSTLAMRATGFFAAATLVIASASGPACAESSPPIHRFKIKGTLDAADTAQVHGELDLTKPSTEWPVERQESDRFALSAKLAQSPLICLDDTIFSDGFDTPQ